MKSKKRFLLLVFLLAIIFSSCAKRRFESLSERRQHILAGGKISSQEDSIVPENIVKLSINDYKRFYDSLNNPPYLLLKEYQAPKSLTKSQMLEDFDYYFRAIKENYPFFGVINRLYGIDFEKNYDIYEKKIKACKTDQDFIRTMETISADLNNRHCFIADRPYVENSLNYNSKLFNSPSVYHEFLSLNTKKVRDRYQLEGVQTSKDYFEKDIRKKKAYDEENEEKNLSIEDLGDGIVLVRIKEMLGPSDIEEDRKILTKFLESLSAYDKLVIDIRNNSGGSMYYWKDFFLPEILSEDKSVKNHMFFKDGEKTRNILDLEDENVEEIKNIDLASLDLKNTEDLENFSYYKEDNIEIKARGEGFDGKIFLLINDKTFSAAEAMASFVKNANLAKLVGSQTGGDGITLGIINDVMPNSGLVFTYTNTLGFSQDGYINEEEKTKPDINANSFKESIKIIRNME